MPNFGVAYSDVHGECVNVRSLRNLDFVFPFCVGLGGSVVNLHINSVAVLVNRRWPEICYDKMSNHRLGSNHGD